MLRRDSSARESTCPRLTSALLLVFALAGCSGGAGPGPGGCYWPSPLVGPGGRYWSSSYADSVMWTGWILDFSYATVGYVDTGSDAQVRCVRGP